MYISFLAEPDDLSEFCSNWTVRGNISLQIITTTNVLNIQVTRILREDSTDLQWTNHPNGPISAGKEFTTALLWPKGEGEPWTWVTRQSSAGAGVRSRLRPNWDKQGTKTMHTWRLRWTGFWKAWNIVSSKCQCITSWINSIKWQILNWHPSTVL